MTDVAVDKRDAHGVRRRLLNRGAFFILALCLLAPSIWMLATIPPLWRDLSAYHQVTGNPGQAAAGGHGPLYGIVARLPLYIGYQIERTRGDVVTSRRYFFNHPTLTDTGVFLLILAQHLALCASALSLIMAAAKPFWARLGLALFFASNPLFYTFAQCVGSESLSLVVVLLFTIAALRLVKRPVTPRSWIFCAVALFTCIVTRYANLLFILALPLTFLLVALQRRSFSPLRSAALALAIGIVCVYAGRFATSAFCFVEGTSYYSKAGYTFLWRVQFLKAVPEPRRTELLEEVSARARSRDAQQVTSVLRDLLQQERPLSAKEVITRLRVDLGEDGERARMQRVHAALNEAVRAFLVPPTPEHWRAAHKDFVTARNMTPLTLTESLFGTTGYHFLYPDQTLELAPLLTFRNYSGESLLAIPAAHAYLRFWSGTPAKCWLLLTMAGGAALLVVGNRKRLDVTPIWLYGIALIVVGLLFVRGTTLLGEMLPRYTLPLWEALWATCIIYAGALADALVSRREAARAIS